MKKNTIGETLRKAAKMVESGDETFSCNAIRFQEGWQNEHSPKIQKALKFYGDALLGRKPVISDFENNKNGSWVPEKQSKNHRVVALCLAATLANKGVKFDDDF